MSKGAGVGGGGGWAKTAAGGRTRVVSSGGVKFRKSDRAVANGDVLVKVSVKKLDSAWKKDGGFYLGKGGGDPGRAAGVKVFMAKGTPVNAPEVAYDSKTGRLAVTDGRHRIQFFREEGKAHIYVSVSKGNAKTVQKDLGA